MNINLENASEVGENVKVVKVDNLLVFVVDTNKDLGLSSTGKMRCVANTGGFTFLPGDLKGNIYIGKKA
jgi:hypothetical protein